MKFWKVQEVLRLSTAIAAITVVFLDPSFAMTGSASTASADISRSIVTVVGSRGNVCTGSLIAPHIVLTAGHCITPNTSYRVVDSTTQPPRLITVSKVVAHPQFNMQTMLAHRATADVALLLLPAPVPKKEPAQLGVPRTPIAFGSRFTVAGIGVTAAGSDAGIGTVRTAALTVTGHPGTLQIRLVDPATDNKRVGMGACTGDSGAPVFEDQSGRAMIVGVVSWSTGPGNSDGCGGLTGVTPLTLYKDWIVKTTKNWGASPLD